MFVHFDLLLPLSNMENPGVLYHSSVKATSIPIPPSVIVLVLILLMVKRHLIMIIPSRNVKV